MAIFNGSDLIITLAADGGTEQKLLHATSCTYSLNRDTIDISSKDSANGFREILSGQGSFTISADGLMVFDFMLNRTKVDFTFALLLLYQLQLVTH
jgi:TP901-1 family phage major tail protein